MKNITAEFVHGAIDGLIDARFRNEDGEILHYVSQCFKCPYDEVECKSSHCAGAEFRIDEEIGTMLDTMGVDNEVERIHCYGDNTVDIYAICIVFMAEGTFHTHNFVTEA